MVWEAPKQVWRREETQWPEMVWEATKWLEMVWEALEEPEMVWEAGSSGQDDRAKTFGFRVYTFD